MRNFKLPTAIEDLVASRNKLRDHYQAMLEAKGGTAQLHFTFDGNLVGDIGEALAAELFGIRLIDTKSTEGIDGYAPDGRTVQVKATGTGRGPAFRQTQIRADHLLFFDLDLEALTGTVVFNGPEHIAIARLPVSFSGQRSLTAKQIRNADRDVSDKDRLQVVAKG